MGQHLVDSAVAVSREQDDLGRIQPLAEYRGKVVQVGQFIVHKKAGVFLAHILDHVRCAAPVGAARGVHQVPITGAEGEGGEEYRLAFEAFHLV